MDRVLLVWTFKMFVPYNMYERCGRSKNYQHGTLDRQYLKLQTDRGGSFTILYIWGSFRIYRKNKYHSVDPQSLWPYLLSSFLPPFTVVLTEGIHQCLRNRSTLWPRRSRNRTLYDSRLTPVLVHNLKPVHLVTVGTQITGRWTFEGRNCNYRHTHSSPEEIGKSLHKGSRHFNSFTIIGVMYEVSQRCSGFSSTRVIHSITMRPSPDLVSPINPIFFTQFLVIPFRVKQQRRQSQYIGRLLLWLIHW